MLELSRSFLLGTLEVPGGAESFLATLGTWLPGKEYTLLYRGSVDGLTPKAFHRLCDSQGPTVTLIRSDNGSCFGGYASAPWNGGVRGSVADGEAFLFTVVNTFSGGDPPTRFPVSDPSIAITGQPYYGPCFGNEALVLSNGTEDSSGQFSIASYTQFPFGYVDTLGKGDATFTGAKYFSPVEVEVWAVL